MPTTKTSRSREKPEQIADELRALIVAGELEEGESLGREPDLVERFGVSRPSLREALRILEAEGLITVVRGVLGGVVAHQPDERMTARTAALVLQARNVTLGDVHQARSMIEPAAVRVLASSPSKKTVDELEVAGRGPARGDRGPRGVRTAPTPASTSAWSSSRATRRSASSPRCSTRSSPAPSPR